MVTHKPRLYPAPHHQALAIPHHCPTMCIRSTPWPGVRTSPLAAPPNRTQTAQGRLCAHASNSSAAACGAVTAAWVPAAPRDAYLDMGPVPNRKQVALTDVHARRWSRRKIFLFGHGRRARQHGGWRLSARAPRRQKTRQPSSQTTPTRINAAKEAGQHKGLTWTGSSLKLRMSQIFSCPSSPPVAM